MLFRFGVVLLCLFITPIKAVLTEYSASANALSGLSILSGSVSDFYLSPLVNSSGICATWNKPFGNAETSVYGLHNAFYVGKIMVATGINYLNHPDYRWQDEYLSLSLNYSSLALGATQHLVYDKIGDESWFAWDNDFGLSISSKQASTELRYLRSRSADAQLILSVSQKLNEYSTVASAYTWHKGEPGTYAFASSYQIAKPLLLQCSWQSEPARFGAGMKVVAGKFALMYAVRTHSELSMSHCLDLEATW